MLVAAALTDINAALVVWTTVTFALLIVVLGKFAWGPILQMIETREKTIADALESAKKERAAAEAARAEMQMALEKARASFPEELWARVDEKLLFAPLERSEIARVAHLLLADSARRLREERGIDFRTGPGLVEHLVSAGGFQVSLGARPMRQTIERLVESPLADAILSGRVRAGERLVACAGPSGVEFRKEA